MSGADWGDLSVNIYGLGDTSFTLYEDDGETEGYLDGKYRTTDISVKALASDTWQIDVGATVGDFDTEYTKRNITFRIHSYVPISAATVGDEAATVTPIMSDATALPFAESGASPMMHIYEITAEVDLTKGTTLLVTTGIAGDADNSGSLSVTDALLTLKAALNKKGLPTGDINADLKLSLKDVLQILKNIVR